MRKVLAVIGRPGTGKTTLFKQLISEKQWETVELVKLVNSLYCKELDLHILGKYEEGEVFAGTDRLSMAVMPEVKKFIEQNPSNILFEGDRLTSSAFFEYLTELPDTEVKIIVLSANEDLLLKRYAERGSNQSDQFLKGRITKLNNIRTNFSLMDNIETFDNNDLSDQAKILSYIRNFLNMV